MTPPWTAVTNLHSASAGLAAAEVTHQWAPQRARAIGHDFRKATHLTSRANTSPCFLKTAITITRTDDRAGWGSSARQKYFPRATSLLNMGNVNTKHNASDEAPTYFPYSEEEDLGLWKWRTQNCCTEGSARLLLVSWRTDLPSALTPDKLLYRQ